MLRWCLGGLAYGALLGGVTLIPQGLGSLKRSAVFPRGLLDRRQQARVFRRLNRRGSSPDTPGFAAAASRLGSWRSRRRRICCTTFCRGFRSSVGSPSSPPGATPDRRSPRTVDADGDQRALSLSVHAAAAAIAVPAVAALWTFRNRESSEAAASDPWRDADHSRPGDLGPRADSAATPSRIVVARRRDPAIRDNVMGGDPVAAICFAAGMLTALFLMHLLVAARHGRMRQRRDSPHGLDARRDGHADVGYAPRHGACVGPVAVAAPGLRADLPPLQRNP